MCATIPYPKETFSYSTSCPFTETGRGEFEIDEEIEIKHLDEAGFVFGVNFHGDPIVCDAKGKIRKLLFRMCSKCEEECDCSPRVHIGGCHDLQTKLIFQLSYENRLVVGIQHKIADVV